MDVAPTREHPTASSGSPLTKFSVWRGRQSTPSHCLKRKCRLPLHFYQKPNHVYLVNASLCFRISVVHHCKTNRHLSSWHLPRSHHFARVWGQNHNRRWDSKPASATFRMRRFQQYWLHVHFTIVFSAQPCPRGAFMVHSGCRPNIPGISTTINL